MWVDMMLHTLMIERRIPDRIRRPVRKFLLKPRFWYYWFTAKDRKIKKINDFEYSKYSQNGEDGILKIILYKIGVKKGFFVEFGVEDGKECNTRLLKEGGWDGLMMDGTGSKDRFVKKEFITAENINDMFRKYDVPEEFEVLSIDIDGNDYWVWDAIRGYRPKVVIIEYNSSVPSYESKAIRYDSDFVWDKTDYFGASLLAIKKLGESKGYELVACDDYGVNAFFVRKDLVEGKFGYKEVCEIYRPPRYGRKDNGKYIGHPKSGKVQDMVQV